MRRFFAIVAATVFLGGAALLGYGLMGRGGMESFLGAIWSSAISAGGDGESAIGEGKGEQYQNPPPKQQAQPQPPLVKTSHKPVKNGGRFWYDRLGTDEQQLYRRIEQAVLNLDNYIDTTDLYITTTQLERVIQFCDSDHPEYFWTSKSYQYRYDQNNPDKILMVIMLYTDGTVADEPSKGYELRKTADRNEIYRQRQQFNAEVEAFLATVPVGASDTEKEKLAHDFVVDRVEYDASSVGNLVKGQEHSYTSYGALVGRLAVCEGYSELLQYLANQLGLKCIVVSGTSQGENHQWNILWLEGSPVHVDPTWNDNGVFADMGMRSYLYYNLSDEDIARTHSVGTSLNIPVDEYTAMLPQCTDSSYYYYHYAAVNLKQDFTVMQNAPNVVLSAMRRKDTSLLVFFPKGSSLSEQKSWVGNEVYTQQGEVYQMLTEAADSLGIQWEFHDGYYTYGDLGIAAIRIAYP